MLVPRFSLRLILGLMAAVAVGCLVATLAMQGQQWAIGLTALIAAVLMSATVYAALFTVAYLLARLVRLVRPEHRASSPFAGERLPPQIIPPRPDLD